MVKKLDWSFAEKVQSQLQDLSRGFLGWKVKGKKLTNFNLKLITVS